MEMTNIENKDDVYNELPYPWEEYVTDTGEKYFFNPHRDFTTWTRPTAANTVHQLESPSSSLLSPSPSAGRSSPRKRKKKRKQANISIDLFEDDDLLSTQRVTLTFDRISFKTEDNKCILNSLSGVINPGTMQAIMGPSGCGKTTLLDILSGKKTTGYEGVVYVNGEDRENGLFQRISAYVSQCDILNPLLTITETLFYYANLRINESVARFEKWTRVHRLINVLGLRNVATSLVGDNMIRGISGGQKKRLSIAKALLGEPRLLFLDEPTSGLSATDSQLLIDTLRNIVDSCNTTVVAVIHQPRSSVFNQFDQLLLLTKGDCVYNGPIDIVIDYMYSLQLKQPHEVSDADWILDLVSPNSAHQCIKRLKENYYENERPIVLHAVANELNNALTEVTRGPAIKELLATSDYPSQYCVTSFENQFLFLVRYFKLLTLRDEAEINQRMSNALMMSTLIGSMFFQSQDESALVKSSIIFLCLLSTSMSCLDLLPKFVNGRVLFQFDTSEGIYEAKPYYCALSLIYFTLSLASNSLFCGVAYWMCGLRQSIPHFIQFFGVIQLSFMVMESLIMFISIISKTGEAASASASVILGFGSLFSGLIANPNTLKWYVRWMLWISPLWYAFEALTIIEHEGREYTTDPMFNTSYDIYEHYGIVETRYETDILIMILFFCVFRIAGMIGLNYLNKRKV